ncbi:hypothetical protein [Photorhabdus luminescens]|uniref:Uncharacterized protein n=1 Tax=Photorhabdus luminescens subsp. mexicana TaxID=2100167 RepID=A0A4R4JMZ5_PHOLU|nr:hypothetical protein [Photorhabdus luminescens]TDB55703.1 hypothetical protein C5468_03530 [Photorhabdus luminescens subsp. mexicana]
MLNKSTSKKQDDILNGFASIKLSNENHFVVDDKKIHEIHGLSNEVIKEINEVAKELNDLIYQGELKIEGSGSNKKFLIQEEKLPYILGPAPAYYSSNSHNYFRYCPIGILSIPGFEFGIEIEILKKILAGTSAAAALAAVIPDVTMTKIMATVLGVLSGGISVIINNAKGRKVWHVRGMLPNIPFQFWYD